MRTRPRPLLPAVLAAALALALALGTGVGSGARAQEAAPSAEEVKAKIAALELDEAKDLLAKFKSAAKSTEEKAAAKDLEKELATARRIEPVATKQVAKLAADGKPREAYALAMTTVDQFPGALGLRGLVARARDARDAAFHTVDDFDKSVIPPGTHQGGATTKKAVNINGILVFCSAIELVDDPMGGKALRWEWKQLTGSDWAMLVWEWKEPIDLDEFEYATVRFRSARPLAKALKFQLVSAPRDKERCLKVSTMVASAPGWREVRVAFDKPDKKIDFDPKKTVAMCISSFSPGPVEVFIDDVMLARKIKK